MNAHVILDFLGSYILIMMTGFFALFLTVMAVGGVYHFIKELLHL